MPRRNVTADRPAMPGGDPAAVRALDLNSALAVAREDPESIARTVVELQVQAAEAAESCRRACSAAENLEQILADLLHQPPEFWRLEYIENHDHAPPRAVCRRGNQLRAFHIHPQVEPFELEQLEPWHYALVHPQESVVIGSSRNEALLRSSLGEIVELRGWFDAERGLAWVTHPGHADRIVQLAPALREQNPSPGARIALLRDDDSQAVAALPDESGSRFDCPLASIQARLDDLAGIDDLIQRLAEEAVLRVIEPLVSQRFDLAPLSGLLLYSHRPGTGKTTFAQAYAWWLHELGQVPEHRFDVELLFIKPNQLKSMWHGGDAQLVRELGTSLRARLRRSRPHPLVMVVLMDEVDSLGRRAGAQDPVAPTSSAHNDAVQSLLVEMDEIHKAVQEVGDPPAWVLWIGLTNRPDLVDAALQREDRLGSLRLEMPDLTLSGAESVCAVYCRHPDLAWHLDGNVRAGVALEEIRSRLLRPALSAVFPTPVLRYFDDQRRATDVAAGQLLAGVHYKRSVQAAKRRAALRAVLGSGIPAVSYDDLIESLIETACSVARQFRVDPRSLVEQLRLRVPVVEVELIHSTAHAALRYLRAEEDTWEAP